MTICSKCFCVINIIVIMCICSKKPTILADSKAEDRYLSLEQLGKVFKILSQRLPGKFYKMHGI